MKAQIVKLPFQFLLTVFGIFLLGSLPYLFFDIESHILILKMIESGSLDNADFLYDELKLNYNEYVSQIGYTIKAMLTPLDMTYYSRGAYLDLFPDFLHKYVYSMVQLCVALIIGLLLAILITFSIMMLPNRMKRLTKFILFILESLPDLFVVLLFQMIVIWVYEKTEILLFNITNSYGEPAYLLPTIILSFLPMIYISKYLLLAFEYEQEKLYVELARGKGMKNSSILLKHILRNAAITLFNNFKTIFWFALSNLLMLEIVFNLDGFTSFIVENGVINPHIMTIGLLMVFVPFFMIFSLGNFLIRKVVR